jgi:hypothetical protein
MKLPSFLRAVAAPAAAARDGRVETYRAEVNAAAATGDRARFEQLLGRPAELGLSDEDAALELEHVQGLLEALDLREHMEQGDPLPVIKTAHRAIAGETCHFLAPASLPDGLMDQGGKLFLTDQRILYLGSSCRTAAWRDVTEVRDHERDLLFTVRPLDLLRFRCNSYVDTLRALVIARCLAARIGT